MARKPMISPIHALLQQAEGYATTAGYTSESANLRSLQVPGDYRATQALVLARYRSQLSVDEQQIGNVALLACERYVADWVQLLQGMGLLAQPYEPSGQFPRDWLTNQQHAMM